MSTDSPVSIIFNTDGYQVSVKNNNFLENNKVAGLLISGSDGQKTHHIKTDEDGYIIVSNAVHESDSIRTYFRNGLISTISTMSVPLTETIYNEPISSGYIRKIVSSNINDTLLGTGARQIKIIYYDDNLDGPFFETVNLNGTTTQDTINTNIRFIEEINVISAGSDGYNVGFIIIKDNLLNVIGTIYPCINKTNWAHHYISTDKICNVISISAGCTGNQASTFYMKEYNPIISDFSNNITDNIRISPGSSTVRNYSSTISITGPKRIILYVTPDGTINCTQFGSIEYYEK